MIIINNIEQNSPEWDTLRMGIPTASNFKLIVTTKGKRSASREKYLYKVAGESLSGEKQNGYYNSSMARGHEREAEARNLYAFTKSVKVDTPAFCYRDEEKLYGCSPDGLVGEDGGFENKNAESWVQLDRLENEWTGTEHFQQVQGSLFITGRKWWDLMSYSRGLKPIIKRFYPDPVFFRNLHIELNLFNKDLTKLIKEHKA